MAYTVGTAQIIVSTRIGNAIPIEIATADVDFEGRSDGARITIDVAPGLARALREIADQLENVTTDDLEPTGT